MDPLAFVNPVSAKATIPNRELPAALKLSKKIKGRDGTPIHANTIMVALAVHEKGYIAEIPGGQNIDIDFGSVKPVKVVASPAVAFQNGPAVKN